MEHVERMAEKHQLSCYLEGVIPMKGWDGIQLEDVVIAYHAKFKNMDLIEGYRLLGAELLRHAEMMEKINGS